MALLPLSSIRSVNVPDLQQPVCPARACRNPAFDITGPPAMPHHLPEALVAKSGRRLRVHGIDDTRVGCP
jgi:hypothetical protein